MTRYLLYPISQILQIIVQLRNKLYNLNILSSISSKIPILSVGNIEMGGTGKTPFVIELAQQLIDNNIRPLIVTRGYKRNTTKQMILNHINQYSAQEVGDEPYYMKQVLDTVPIIIDNNKQSAIKQANEMTGVDCIILDDGYQSRYIQRNIDIVLINTSQHEDYFVMMPVGGLREPVTNLNRADFIYTTKDNHLTHQFLKYYNTTHLNVSFKLIKYQNGIKVEDNVTNIKNDNIVAFCGIANGVHFFNALDIMKINIKKKQIFTNHVIYNNKNILKLENMISNNDSLITTYKDFVKLNESFVNKHIIYVVEMKMNINDDNLMAAIKQLVAIKNEN